VLILGAEATKTDHDSLIQNEEGADVDAIYAEVRAMHWHTAIPLYVLTGIKLDAPRSLASICRICSHRIGRGCKFGRDVSMNSLPLVDGESHASQNNCEKSWPPGSGRLLPRFP
jgi:hypothetical protein